jgi:hypothetical protein
VVNQYVVTISPYSEQNTEPQSHMIVRIDVSGGAAHVVELTVRASAGADLVSGQLPSIDLERLAQVFGSPTAPGTAAVKATSGAAVDEPVIETPALAPAPAPSSPPTKRSTGRPGRRSAAATESRKTDDRNVTAARAYRRMPDPDELRERYIEIGSIAGVAKHYGVPTHTAQGWIGRLRQLDV